MELLDKIKGLAKELHPEVIRLRRHLHAHPELSYQEFETARFVADTLKSMGLEPVEGIAGTGVTALIEGRNPSSRTIALRADLDALPIAEKNDVPYKSTKEGIMHACGHDVHTSSLLGTAMILSRLRDEFEGTVKLIFQPGEEKNPGGASLMIKEGVLESPRPDYIFGQHVMPLMPVGKIGFKPGMYMASADEIYLTVHGKGGHGALPEMAIDPVLIASHIIVGLQQVISRNANPKKPSVLTFGKVIANGATNIIPDKVEIAGTFRALDEEWRAKAHVLIRQMAEHIALGMGGSCDVNIDRGYPFLKNDEALTARARNFAEAYVGKDNVIDLDIWMGAEDFSYYSQELPACFYRLGTRNEARGITSYVHTPTFDIDEAALEIGIGLMAWMAINA
ncbi:M20 metallopeptidase family protein [Fulvivirga sedimenti]|uniref:M20 family metallopeptidase n=1 Tax=Fulvivirga sedimenti TaxID=2879465 RepID=A0A9X1HLU9_9BACT|nr:M20 family metallopeptidase [Fulvivirga sedimenti]MCA6074370.1 M20 family metallopeptidase [Fulvivirga sedimenti]